MNYKDDEDIGLKEFAKYLGITDNSLQSNLARHHGNATKKPDMYILMAYNEETRSPKDKRLWKFGDVKKWKKSVWDKRKKK